MLTKALGAGSHAEGGGSIASGSQSHAEGAGTLALGAGSHAEGTNTISIGSNSHAEGELTVAFGNGSHAEGYSTVASGSYQTVVGKFNASNNTSSLFVVGAGSNTSTRVDGFSVETDGTKAHIVIPTNTSNPTNPKTGSMYFNPSTNIMYIYNGTTWKTASFA